MGLADRYYMRQSSGGIHWSATTTLLAINWVVFLVFLILNPIFLDRYLALSLEGLRHGFVWQLITFQFLHGGWMHIIFNSLGLFFIGRAVESMLGARRFIHLYLLCGIVGGLLQMAFAAAMPLRYGGGVVGASAGVFGLLGTFSMMNWSNRFIMFIYFFPVPMTGRTLLWISLILTAIGVAFPSGNVAYASHLGGLLMGIAWVRLGWHRDFVELPWENGFHFLSRLNPFKRVQRHRQLVKAAAIKVPGWTVSKGAPTLDITEEEFISKEVDPILDKISEHGIQSLTERERAILERARNKMAKR